MYSRDLIEKLNLPLEKEYGEYMFISASSIISINIINFDPGYAILLGDYRQRLLYESNSFIVIPRTVHTNDYRIKLR